jgi:hypothetical protein
MRIANSINDTQKQFKTIFKQQKPAWSSVKGLKTATVSPSFINANFNGISNCLAATRYYGQARQLLSKKNCTVESHQLLLICCQTMLALEGQPPFLQAEKAIENHQVHNKRSHISGAPTTMSFQSFVEYFFSN